MVTKVMIVDDHPLIRDVLSDLLADHADLTVVGSAASAQEALDLGRVTRPDVVVMDIDLPGADGITATRSLLALDPSIRVVMLSASCSHALICESAEAGAYGYLLKGDPADSIPEGIRAAARGDHPVSPQVVALCGSSNDWEGGDATSPVWPPGRQR